MFFAMIEVFKGAGILIYPLGICSAGAVFIICERAYALRKAAVMPEDLVDAVVAGKPLVGGRHTVWPASSTLPSSTRTTKAR